MFDGRLKPKHIRHSAEMVRTRCRHSSETVRIDSLPVQSSEDKQQIVSLTGSPCGCFWVQRCSMSHLKSPKVFLYISTHQVTETMRFCDRSSDGQLNTLFKEVLYCFEGLEVLAEF